MGIAGRGAAAKTWVRGQKYILVLIIGRRFIVII